MQGSPGVSSEQSVSEEDVADEMGESKHGPVRYLEAEGLEDELVFFLSGLEDMGEGMGGVFIVAPLAMLLRDE